MYCDKANVNTLTALLMAHGVRDAIVCPGSRNAPIVHNLNLCPDIHCYPVTDERSAGFYALGLAEATARPVVVCVTSGSALLNVLPAVAEAYYRHVPVVVISADRPKEWIDQLDGQTLPQEGALGRFVRKVVSLPEWDTDGSERATTQHWYCNRIINETLSAAMSDGGGPVHINVPLTPPLYHFTVPKLPNERVIKRKSTAVADLTALNEAIERASRPIIVIGQTHEGEISEDAIFRLAQQHIVVLQEALSGNILEWPIDRMMETIKDDDSYLPDFILYMGDTIVSQGFKAFLRRAHHAACWRVDAAGEMQDTFMNLSGSIKAAPREVLEGIHAEADMDWHEKWQALSRKTTAKVTNFYPEYSSIEAVRAFEEIIVDKDCAVHYANSMSVRLGCLYAHHFIHCNRGVNGIEGSLSTAAGYSLSTKKPVYCVIGDLSFFYDQNALWNTNLRGNLRILLLNNGGGGIFQKFDALQKSVADSNNVMALHLTSAQGICMENHVEYHCATNEMELHQGIIALTAAYSHNPILLEVITDTEQDWVNYRKYFQHKIKE